MKWIVLSVRQPWAWLIVNGHKDIENRTWKTAHRGQVLIHAGKEPAATPKIINGVLVPEMFHYRTGGIVGMVEITECVTSSKSKWFEGPYGFVLTAAKAIPFIPLRGRLGFFQVDLEIEP